MFLTFGFWNRRRWWQTLLVTSKSCWYLGWENNDSSNPLLRCNVRRRSSTSASPRSPPSSHVVSHFCHWKYYKVLMSCLNLRKSNINFTWDIELNLEFAWKESLEFTTWYNCRWMSLPCANTMSVESSLTVLIRVSTKLILVLYLSIHMQIYVFTINIWKTIYTPTHTPNWGSILEN